MSRLSKILICILLVFSTLLSGCVTDGNSPSNNEPENKNIDNEPIGKEVNSPVEISYVIHNPIEIKDIDVSKDDNNTRKYFEISGLRNKDIEKSINNDIKELFDKLLPYVNGEKLPPYRGIKAAVDDVLKIRLSNILIRPEFNSNNVLSVVAYVEGRYSADSKNVYFSMNESLNFDLNTGKTFKIEDIFTNEVNGLEIVNDAIINEVKQRRLDADVYDVEDVAFSLVSPFKGISHEQKFHITQNGINVILDYNNPEFSNYLNYNTINSRFSYNGVFIPFYSRDKNIAITKRFFNENNSIFIKEPKTKSFLRDYQVDMYSERNSFKKDGIEGYLSINYPKNISETIIDDIYDIQLEEKNWIDNVAKEKLITYIEQNIYAHKIGSYININSSIQFGGKNNNGWRSKSYVYSENGELVGLEDLFVKNYDYESLIKSSFNKVKEQEKMAENIDTESLLDNLMFTVQDSSISFTTNTNNIQNDNNYPIYFNIPYEEIGYKNLTIFD